MGRPIKSEKEAEEVDPRGPIPSTSAKPGVPGTDSGYDDGAGPGYVPDRDDTPRRPKEPTDRFNPSPPGAREPNIPKTQAIGVPGYAGSGPVGGSRGLLDDPNSIGQAFLGNRQTTSELVFNDFSRGMVTRYDRGQQPLGSCYEIRNFMLNSKTGGLEQRWGFETAVDASSGIAAYGAGETIAGVAGFRRKATEVPTAQYQDILWGVNGSAAKRIFQRAFWDGTGTLKDTSWLWWGESTTGLTINGAPSGANIVLSAGGSATNDYYNGWVIYNAAAAYPYLFVTDYVGTSKTLTISHAIPSDWSSGAAVTLYRSFHDNTGFAPSYTSPVVLQQGNAILFSGGRGSDVGYKPIWSGYVSKTFMTGNGDNTYTFTGTYVTEAEIKTGGITTTVGNSTESGEGLTPGKRFFIAVVYETDDGQRSNLVVPATNYYTIPDATTDVTVTLALNLFPAQLNKRIRYINIFAGFSDDTSATTLGWENYYWVERLDLTDGSTWTFTDVATTTAAYHGLTYELTLSKFEQPPNVDKEDLITHLGSSEFTASTVSFNYAEFVNDRLFVADYYDYTAALTYNDQVRYTVFASNGRGQLNSLRDIDDTTQSTIQQGDDTAITGLSKLQDKLLVVKNRSCYYIPAFSDVSLIQLITISSTIGCDAPKTLVATPFGVLWVKVGDDVYMWRGANPEPMMTDYRPTFVGLAAAYPGASDALWEGWYDDYAKTYNFAPSSGDFSDYISIFFELPTPVGFAIARHSLRAAVGGVSVGADGVIYMADIGNGEYVYNFDPTVTADGASAIQPYLDTGDYSVTESEVAHFEEWHLTQTPTTGAGTLAVSITVDGGTAISGLSDLTKTATRLSSQLPVSALGRIVRLKYNTNGTLATFASLSLHELGFRYRITARKGDKRHSL